MSGGAVGVAPRSERSWLIKVALVSYAVRVAADYVIFISSMFVDETTVRNEWAYVAMSVYYGSWLAVLTIPFLVGLLEGPVRTKQHMKAFVGLIIVPLGVLYGLERQVDPPEVTSWFLLFIFVVIVIAAVMFGVGRGIKKLRRRTQSAQKP